MKKTVIMLAVMAVIELGFADVSIAGRIGKRQIRQNKQIHQGVKSGELTVHETNLLMLEQHRIQRTKKRALIDGILTPKERLRMEIMQDKTNRHIYRLKHNDRGR